MRRSTRAHQVRGPVTGASKRGRGTSRDEVEAAARGTGLTPEQIEEYQGVVSVEAGTAHCVGVT
ncbi:hypothetical protein CP979_25060 [Streptomyces filamentosus]|nr:hypothetical protein CP979_25060 [Streptomyces filamentosus]